MLQFICSVLSPALLVVATTKMLVPTAARRQGEDEMAMMTHDAQ